MWLCKPGPAGRLAEGAEQPGGTGAAEIESRFNEWRGPAQSTSLAATLPRQPYTPILLCRDRTGFPRPVRDVIGAPLSMESVSPPPLLGQTEP